jgi:hypothetical protein
MELVKTLLFISAVVLTLWRLEKLREDIMGGRGSKSSGGRRR